MSGRSRQGRMGHEPGRQRGRPALPVLRAHALTSQDPPEHSRFRRAVNPFFTRSRVADLRPRVDAIVAGLLDAAIDTPGGASTRSTRWRSLSITVISELLDIPTSNHDMLRDLSNNFLSAWISTARPTSSTGSGGVTGVHLVLRPR